MRKSKRRKLNRQQFKTLRAVFYLRRLAELTLEIYGHGAPNLDSFTISRKN